MAKVRRTRKEKIRANLRQSSASVPAQTSSSSAFSYSLPSLQKTTPSSTSSLTYTHIATDLRKTLFITGTIIVAQFILFMLLQNR